MTTRPAELGRPLAFATLIAVVTVFLLAVLPVKGQASTWAWQAPMGAPTQDLVLVSEPSRLTFTTTGELATAVAAGSQLPVTFFDTGPPENYGSLRLMAQGNAVYVEFAGVKAPGLSLPLSAAGQVVLDYTPGEIQLRSGFEVRSASVADFAGDLPAGSALQVHVAGPRLDPMLTSGSALRVSAPPSTMSWPWWRWLLVAVVVIAFVRPNRLLQKAGAVLRAPKGPRVVRSDVLVLSLGLAGLILNPPLPDDNWVLVTNRQLPDVGFFSNYYSANAAPQPQGFWWSLVEHVWLGQYWVPAFWLRVPSVALLVMAWWLLRRYVLDEVLTERVLPVSHALGGWLMAVMMLAWSPTLRPEPVVVLLSVLGLVFAVALRRQMSLAFLQLVGATAALAFAVHQSGLIVVGMFVACLGYAWRWGPSSRPRAVSATLGVVSLTGALLLLHSNAQVALWSARSFATEGLHDAMLDEVRRFEGLATPGILAVRLFAALLLYGSIVAYAASPRRRRLVERDFVALVAIAGLVSLVFTSSKWPWHFGAASALVAAAFVMGLGNALVTRGWGGQRYLLIIAGGLGLSWAIVMSHRYETARLDTLTVSLTELTQQLWFRAAFGAWTALLVVSLVFWAVSRRAGRTRGLTAVMGVLTVVVVLRTFVPAVLDEAQNPGEAWPSVMLSSATGNACGILAAPDMRIPTQTVPVPIAGGSLTPVLSRQVGSADEGADWRPPVAAGAWRPIGAGPTATPWFEVDPGRQIRISFRQPVGQLQFRVVWAGADLVGIASQDVVRKPRAASWGMIDLVVPAGATRVAVFWDSGNGPEIVQGPVVIRSTEPVSKLVGDGGLWTNPASGLWGSCLRMPQILSGEFERFAWSLDYPAVGPNAALWSGVASISEQACRDLLDGDRLCIYRLDRTAAPAPEPTLRVTTWESQ